MPLLFDKSRRSGQAAATRRMVSGSEHERPGQADGDQGHQRPNDAKQNSHETILHRLCLVTLQDCLHLAPIGPYPQRILDVGTGNGTWATAMAERFPNTAVIGIDLSAPVQRTIEPSNVTFVVGNCCSAWTFREDNLDFIHIRGLCGSIEDWPGLYRQANRHLRPGAWIEQLEWSVHLRSADGTLTTNRTLRQWSENAVRFGMLTGKTFEIAENMAGLMREAGFENVIEKRFKWPVGSWSSDARLQEIGRWNLSRMEEGLAEWMVETHIKVLGYSYAQVKDMLEEVRASLRDCKVRVYHEVRLVYGRKPQ